MFDLRGIHGIGRGDWRFTRGSPCYVDGLPKSGQVEEQNRSRLVGYCVSVTLGPRPYHDSVRSGPVRL